MEDTMPVTTPRTAAPGRLRPTAHALAVLALVAGTSWGLARWGTVEPSRPGRERVADPTGATLWTIAGRRGRPAREARIVLSRVPVEPGERAALLRTPAGEFVLPRSPTVLVGEDGRPRPLPRSLPPRLLLHLRRPLEPGETLRDRLAEPRAAEALEAAGIDLSGFWE